MGLLKEIQDLERRNWDLEGLQYMKFTNYILIFIIANCEHPIIKYQSHRWSQIIPDHHKSNIKLWVSQPHKWKPRKSLSSFFRQRFANGYFRFLYSNFDPANAISLQLREYPIRYGIHTNMNHESGLNTRIWERGSNRPCCLLPFYFNISLTSGVCLACFQSLFD